MMGKRESCARSGAGLAATSRSWFSSGSGCTKLSGAAWATRELSDGRVLVLTTRGPNAGGLGDGLAAGGSGRTKLLGELWGAGLALG